MDPRSRVELRAGTGLVDDAKQSRTRQVTSVSRERWKAVAEALGQHVDPVLRRANLLISGVDLENSRGNILRVGSGRLRVNGETRPCERMDEPLPGWRVATRASCASASHLRRGVVRVDVVPIVPAGTILHIISWHDNTEGDRANPNPKNLDRRRQLHDQGDGILVNRAV